MSAAHPLLPFPLPQSLSLLTCPPTLFPTGSRWPTAHKSHPLPTIARLSCDTLALHCPLAHCSPSSPLMFAQFLSHPPGPLTPFPTGSRWQIAQRPSQSVVIPRFRDANPARLCPLVCCSSIDPPLPPASSLPLLPIRSSKNRLPKKFFRISTDSTETIWCFSRNDLATRCFQPRCGVHVSAAFSRRSAASLNFGDKIHSETFA